MHAAKMKRRDAVEVALSAAVRALRPVTDPSAGNYPRLLRKLEKGMAARGVHGKKRTRAHEALFDASPSQLLTTLQGAGAMSDEELATADGEALIHMMKVAQDST